MLHGSTSPLCAPHQLYLWFFYLPFRHADVSQGDARYISCFIWDCVYAVKLRSEIVFLIYYSKSYRHDFFCSFINKGELWNQYPDAGPIIRFLPEVPEFGCFEPEAHLLIQNFLSLRPGNTYDFVTIVANHTRARREVSVRTKQSCWAYGI